MSNTVFDINKPDDPDEYNEQINMDELYEKKKENDIMKLTTYKKILARIHNRIKLTSRHGKNIEYCWYNVPEIIFGVPKYDQGSCIAYIMNNLKENGFIVTYIHPNLLFISWNHWVPDYVRTEIKKKTGNVIDGYGNIIKNDNDENGNSSSDPLNPNTLLLKNSNTNLNKTKNNDDTKAIDSYKPSGQLIYNNEILNSLKTNFNKK